ncbi:MAG: ThiF family adenylyltransferase [Candidatus Nealsonbacteria bacterium]|nr:ThiF family adenylyltransferase [Candidatus Nealsonbacteria bacterium]
MRQHNQEELFKRTCDIIRPGLLQRETPLIVGAGSGGARVAEELVRSGISHIILADLPDERLLEHNIIRHPLGYRDLGRLKTEAVRDRLLDINPACQVEIHGLDFAEDRELAEHLLRKATQCHSCVDNDKARYAINEMIVENHVPAFFAGVFDGGVGGEVIRVMPGGPCYACVASMLNRSPRFEQDRDESFDYSDPDQDQYRSTAALNIDISQIALVHARVALNTLMEKYELEGGSPMEGNYVLFGNRQSAPLFPSMLHCETWQVQKADDCMVCSGLNEADCASQADEIMASATVR